MGDEMTIKNKKWRGIKSLNYASWMAGNSN